MSQRNTAGTLSPIFSRLNNVILTENSVKTEPKLYLKTKGHLPVVSLSRFSPQTTKLFSQSPKIKKKTLKLKTLTRVTRCVLF